MNELLKGQRVYWADPEDELSSGFGTITTVKCSPNEPITHDTIILVALDSGSEIEAYALELQLVFDLVKAEIAEHTACDCLDYPCRCIFNAIRKEFGL